MSRFTACLLVLALVCGSACAESLERVEQRIRKAWEDQTSFRADLRISAMVTAGPNMLPVEGKGTLEFLRHEEKELWRQTLTMTIPAPVDKESHHEAVFDGADLRITNEMDGRRATRKVGSDLRNGAAPPGGGPLLDVLAEGLTLSLRGEDVVDEAPVYVIEGTPKGKNPQFIKGVFYFDQATGIQRRQEIFDRPDSAPAIIVFCENVQPGVKLEPDSFAAEGPLPPAE